MLPAAMGCPHQMALELEARVLVLREANPRWGRTRFVYELAREGVVAVPGRSRVYRALVRNGRIDPARRRRRRADYKRWERGALMELWQSGESRKPRNRLPRPTNRRAPKGEVTAHNATAEPVLKPPRLHCNANGRSRLIHSRLRRNNRYRRVRANV
jgi:hypothetical protein